MWSEKAHTTTLSAERNNYIDYAKAICIVLVVFIHTGFNILDNIILFAMPLFFAATGYTFSLGKRNRWDNIKLRFKAIMLPYLFLMLVYTVLEIIRANIFGYGDASIAFPSLVNTVYGSGIIPFNGEICAFVKDIMSYKMQPAAGVDLILPLNCHLWFFPAMFTAYASFILLVEAIRDNHLLKAAAVSGLVLFASAEAVIPQLCQLPFGLGRGAIGAAFMLFGFWLKDYKAFKNRSGKYYAVTNLIALVIFVGALLLDSTGSALVRSVYGPYGVLSVFATFVGGAAGIWIIFSLCMAIEKLPVERIKNLLSYMGKNVLTIYAWHLAVKFVFDAVYICLINNNDFSLLDQYKMGLIPETSMWFMVFEAIAVIGVCLIISKTRDPVKYIQNR